jgi:UDP-N-acetylglucosamine 2-epimerase (non-hydrolysing)
MGEPGRRWRVLTILGTRPETIKLAPVIAQLAARPDLFESRVCATAQHREMLDQALAPFGITPHRDLDIMVSGQTLPALTARALTMLDAVITDDRPDMVLVQGDTTTAFCGALAAFYRKVPVGHVEAGLRTGDKYAPFPEEANRCFIGQIADLHFAPTERVARQLITTGADPASVHVTGNTVVDALLWMRARVQERTPAAAEPLERDLNGAQVVMVTGHRRESFGDGFENICRSIRDVADAFDDVRFVYPVHLNPQVREPVGRILGGHPRVRLIEPLAYDAFVWLMSRADIILTDSGGVQEEAPVLGKPVLVMRTKTERAEGLESGNARLVGVRTADITAHLVELLRSADMRQKMGGTASPYGDGRAAERIVRIVGETLGARGRVQ